MHALAHADEPLPDVPRRRAAPRRPDRRRRRCARLLLDLAPDEVYNLAALSSVAALVGGARAHGAGQRPGRPSRCWSRPGRCRRSTGAASRFVQASSAEIFGEPDLSPQDEATPIRPVNPYGAAKAYAHRSSRSTGGASLHAVSAILYNHESPRRPATFVTRKITSTVAAIARGEADRLVLGNLDARRDWGWAPDYVDALVRAARARDARDYVDRHRRRPHGARLRRRGVRPRRDPRLGGAGRAPTRRSCGRRTPTDLTGDAAPRPRAPGLGADGRLRRARRPDGRRRPGR